MDRLMGILVKLVFGYGIISLIASAVQVIMSLSCIAFIAFTIICGGAFLIGHLCVKEDKDEQNEAKRGRSNTLLK